MIQSVEGIGKEIQADIQETLDDINQIIKDRKVDGLFIVAFIGDGSTYTNWTDDIEATRLIGSIEIAKHNYLQTLVEG